jgi:hypothetical protein
MQRSYIAEDRIVGAIERAHAFVKGSPWLGAQDALQFVARELDIDLDSHAPDTIPAPAFEDESPNCSDVFCPIENREGTHG